MPTSKPTRRPLSTADEGAFACDTPAGLGFMDEIAAYEKTVLSKR